MAFASSLPSRKKARPRQTTSPGAVTRYEALRASKCLGRDIWRRWSGYHRRSRVESKMNCIKLLGQYLMAVRHCARTVTFIARTNGASPATASMAHLQAPGHRTAGSYRRTERLHRARYTCDSGRIVNRSRERGSPAISRFAQQGLVALSFGKTIRRPLCRFGGSSEGSEGARGQLLLNCAASCLTRHQSIRRTVVVVRQMISVFQTTARVGARPTSNYSLSGQAYEGAIENRTSGVSIVG